jgi:hypothetical protein
MIIVKGVSPCSVHRVSWPGVPIEISPQAKSDGKGSGQQTKMFTTGTPTVKDRIVSIAKSYVRPIIRGKEVKKVEDIENRTMRKEQSELYIVSW